MSQITIFGLALLAVPVFARFARVPTGTRKIYHLIGLAGLLFLLGETTRIVAETIGLIGTIQPLIGYVVAMLAFVGVAVGTVWLSAYYVLHLKDA
ncbi:MAG: hypothetical protein H7A21_11390 [Spirochaetales bacterium]|nr:hypothetical protein [Leptospiraceae bacterium]MCB1324792.1 hypothetical protein [Leptospiraceae bacterium]MCP5482030.1 hypothetical protein [Spirochaetales bacterium]MCP5486511.1 hypothetical protein [Spirochaetales bacterium]